MILEPIDSLIPASYNPRKVDPERLKLVELSIRKLGWVLPVYATKSGELLSGHQRTHVARALGYTHVPCVRLGDMDDRTRKAVNILFNRSTNDMDVGDVPSDLREKIRSIDILGMAEALPDKSNSYPCMAASVEPIGSYVRANSGRWIPYARNVAVTLLGHRIVMPIVVDPAGLVVNGIGRLQMMAEKHYATGSFVHLTAAESVFAGAMLNLLSMDFNVEEKYADLLRYNSFRRARRVRYELGLGFVFQVVNSYNTDSFDYRDPKDAEKWKATYGTSIVDFGAGHLHETEILRSIGVRVSPFEPYRLGVGNDIDVPASLDVAQRFLEDVAAGVQYSSVFISSVLNSVPFEQDRRYIVKICSALCGPSTVCYGWASSNKHPNITAQIQKKGLSERHVKAGCFMLNYEPNVVLGDFGDKPKVQKYHTPSEFYDLFKSAFRVVNVKRCADNCSASAADPIGPAGLREALEFEFNLPYPDGKSMNMVAPAIAAFEKRLGVKL